MVNTNTDRGQPKPHRCDAAGRAGRAPVRDEAIGRIRRIPKVIEIGLLDVIQKFIVVRKKMGNCGQGGRREAFLGGRGQRRDLVKVRLSIDDTHAKITEARRGQQAGILRDEWAATAG